MTPFELFQWAIAVSASMILIGFALCIAVLFVRGAISTRRPK